MELRRPDASADFDQVLEVVQACDRAVYGDTDWTPRELREEWDGIDLGRDAWIAVDGDLVVGVMHLAKVEGGMINVDGYVHPDHRGRGIGSLMLTAAEERAKEIEPALVPGQRVYLETAHLVGDPGAPALLETKGYVRVRTFLRMIRPLTNSDPAPAIPSGIELRPFHAAEHGRVVHEAVEEAFANEWSHRRRAYREWSETVIGWPRFDPELIPVAWAGDEVAGVSLSYPKRMGDWGWIGTLAVRETWRRRGLGLALLHESFRRFAACGETTVALGVDTENPTGAARLYERAGMSVLWRADVWQKELRPSG